MGNITIFEQDGKVYTALSHMMPVGDLARETARGIRLMPKIPRSQMRVITKEEFNKMPFEEPKDK